MAGELIAEMFIERRKASKDAELIRWALHPRAKHQLLLDADPPTSYEMTQCKTIFGLPFVIDETLPEGTWKLVSRERDGQPFRNRKDPQ